MASSDLLRSFLAANSSTCHNQFKPGNSKTLLLILTIKNITNVETAILLLRRKWSGVYTIPWASRFSWILRWNVVGFGNRFSEESTISKDYMLQITSFMTSLWWNTLVNLSLISNKRGGSRSTSETDGRKNPSNGSTKSIMRIPHFSETLLSLQSIVSNKTAICA